MKNNKMKYYVHILHLYKCFLARKANIYRVVQMKCAEIYMDAVQL